MDCESSNSIELKIKERNNDSVVTITTDNIEKKTRFEDKISKEEHQREFICCNSISLFIIVIFFLMIIDGSIIYGIIHTGIEISKNSYQGLECNFIEFNSSTMNGTEFLNCNISLKNQLDNQTDVECSLGIKCPDSSTKCYFNDGLKCPTLNCICNSKLSANIFSICFFIILLILFGTLTVALIIRGIKHYKLQVY